MQGLVRAFAAIFALSLSVPAAGPIAPSATQVSRETERLPPHPPVSADPAAPKPYRVPKTNVTVPLGSIVRIRCDTDAGGHLGTASVIDGNTLLSASHVVNGAPACTIYDGSNEVALVVYDRNDLDYAVLFSDTGQRERLPINCDGFITGQNYMMIGYAKGGRLVIQSVVATADFTDRQDPKTGQPFKHVRSLRGVVGDRPSAIVGMSGGPILNTRGEIVGTTVAGRSNSSLGYSRELKDTYLCEDEKSPQSK
jgi:S1-C subfamily serine protease